MSTSLDRNSIINSAATLPTEMEETFVYPPEALSDYTIIFKKSEFKVHKQILCKESKYFHNLLINDLSQSEYKANNNENEDNNRLGLPDTIKATTADLNKFLLFLYTPTTLLFREEKIDELIIVLELAQYFHVQQLESLFSLRM